MYIIERLKPGKCDGVVVTDKREKERVNEQGRREKDTESQDEEKEKKDAEKRDGERTGKRM